MADLIETPLKEDGEESVSRRGLTSSYFRESPRARWGLLVLVAGMAAIGLGLWRYFSLRESTDDAQIDGHIIPISAKVGGTVLSVEINDNQYVEAGTVLVKIDPRDIQVALERARAELAQAEAAARAAKTNVPITSMTTGSQVSTARAKVENAQAHVTASRREVAAAEARQAAAQARVVEARANDTKVQHDLARMKQLIAKDEISAQQFDSTVAEAEASQAAVESARADFAAAEQAVAVAQSRLIQAQAELDQTQAELRSAETAPQQVAVTRAHAASADARVKAAQAALDQALLNLEYTTVQAPLSGQISKKTVEIGEIVQPSQPLLALVPLEDIWVTANFKETQLKNMRPGQPAVISVDALGGRKFRAHVDSIAAATGEKFSLLPPENATGNYVKVVQRVPVKIVFEKGQEPHRLLRPGMSVTPTVTTR